MLEAILQELREIRALLENVATRPEEEAEAIQVREIPDQEAREEILRLFREAGTEPLYYSDISERLRLPVEQVVEICSRLEQEGVIGAPSGTLRSA